jgi:hypothetical protein
MAADSYPVDAEGDQARGEANANHIVAGAVETPATRQRTWQARAPLEGPVAGVNREQPGR